MPTVAIVLAASTTTLPDDPDDITAEHSESLPLWFPSSLPAHLRTLPSLSGIIEKEQRLRIAQADDSLAEIRRQRRIISNLYQFKKLNISGTGNKPNTRIRTLFNRYNQRILRHAGRYRAAREALVNIDPDGDWKVRLQPLNAQDICGLGKDVDDTSHGRFEPSWIWLVPRVRSAPDMGDSEEQVNDSMRVEWAKTISRCLRWEEEVELLQEEMRRVITFFKWKAQWWRRQARRRRHRHGTCGKILHGVAAYAEKQAFFMDRLAQSSAECWLPALKAEGIAPSWEADFIVICPESHAQVSVLSTANDDNCDDDWEEEEIDEGEVADDDLDEEEPMDLFDDDD